MVFVTYRVYKYYSNRVLFVETITKLQSATANSKF